MEKELQELLDSVKSELGKEEVPEEFKSALTEFVPAKTAEIDLEAFKKYGAESDAGKEYMLNLQKELSKNSVADFQKSEDFGKLLKDKHDTAVIEALAKFRKENKLDPPTEEEKAAELIRAQQAQKLTDMEKKHNDLASKLALKEVEATAMAELSAAKLPSDLLALVMTGDVDTTKHNIEIMKVIVEKTVADVVKGKLKDIGGTPPDLSGGVKITQAILTDLAEVAKKSGRVEDRVKYAEAKQSFNENK